jgi:hypothetical protein
MINIVRYYSFNGTEFDFIINFGTKYRMGRDNEEV